MSSATFSLITSSVIGTSSSGINWTTALAEAEAVLASTLKGFPARIVLVSVAIVVTNCFMSLVSQSTAGVDCKSVTSFCILICERVLISLRTYVTF